MPDASRAAALSATIERLARMPHIDDYGVEAAKAVMSFRLVALCAQAHHDPVVELTRRFDSVTTATAMLAFLDACGLCWPNKLRVQRPCCRMLGPDETVVASMAKAAISADRAAFDAVLDGFVRVERSERLFDAAVTAMAEV